MTARKNMVVVGTGVAEPATSFTNEEVIEGFDIRYPKDQGDFEKRDKLWPAGLPRHHFGIEARRLDMVRGEGGQLVKRSRADGGVSGNDLAILAGREAIQGIDPAQVGFVVVATATPDSLCFGNDLGAIRKGLGLGGHTKLFPLSIGCAGLLPALNLAEGQLRSGMAGRYALILVQNSASTYLATPEVRKNYGPEMGRKVCQVMFSDMGAALLLELQSGDVGFLSHDHQVDLDCPLMDFHGKVGTHPLEDIAQASFDMHADNVAKNFPRLMYAGWEMVQPTLRQYNISPGDITGLAFHQASSLAIDGVIKRLRGQLPDSLLDDPAAVPRIMRTKGNPAVVSGVCVLIDLLRRGKSGDLIVGLLVGAGGGGAQYGGFVYRQS